MSPNRRKFPRARHRLTCQVLDGDRAYSGIVLDLAPEGIFVRLSSRAVMAAGTEVRTILRTPEEGELALPGRIARVKIVRSELAASIEGGVGIAFQAPPPEGYYALLARIHHD